MSAAYIYQTVLPAAFSLLPPMMESDEARVLLMAIGHHESGFRDRRQIGGTATGMWQFELIGVQGVLTHRSTQAHLHQVLHAMEYDYRASVLHRALEHNDILAAVCARLLLWQHPKALPPIGNEAEAFDYYQRTWRPGVPRIDAWVRSYEAAMETLA